MVGVVHGMYFALSVSKTIASRAPGLDGPEYETARPGASTSWGFAELLKSPGTQTGPLLDGPKRPKLEKPVATLHLSDFLPFFPESDNRFDVASNSNLPVGTFWPVGRHSRRLPVVGASQKNKDDGKS